MLIILFYIKTGVIFKISEYTFNFFLEAVDYFENGNLDE